MYVLPSGVYRYANLKQWEYCFIVALVEIIYNTTHLILRLGLFIKKHTQKSCNIIQISHNADM